jgi:hypothetical protein
METSTAVLRSFLLFGHVVAKGNPMPNFSAKLKTALANAVMLLGAATGQAQTELEVWPTGVNGPQTWPPELHNPWWDAEHKYPEGGAPPPVDLFDRIKCASGIKLKPKAANSAPWEQSRWHPPEYAFDPYTMSRWSSNSSNEKWLAADLGAVKSVDRVYLVWEVAYGKDYDIQFSNDSAAWTTAKQVRGGNGQADVVDLEGTGRYIRMMGVATGSPYGYSLYEFTICQAAGSALGQAGAANAARQKRWTLDVGRGGLPQGIRAFDVSGRTAEPALSPAAAVRALRN